MRIKICVVWKAPIFRKKSLANDPPLPPTFGTLLPNLGKGEGGVVNISSQPDPTAAPPGGYPSSAPSAAPLAAPINSSDPLSDPPVTSACDPSAPDTPPCDSLSDPSSPTPAALPSAPPSCNASPFASRG